MIALYTLMSSHEHLQWKIMWFRLGFSHYELENWQHFMGKKAGSWKVVERNEWNGRNKIKIDCKDFGYK